MPIATDVSVWVIGIISIAASVVTCLVGLLVVGMRGDVKETNANVRETRKDVKDLGTKLDNKADKTEVVRVDERVEATYEWADKRFVNKEVCKTKHEHDSGRQPAVGGAN